MKRFSCTMNMPPPVRIYSKHTKTILRAAKDVAEKTTKDAAQEIFSSKIQDGEEIAKTAVSCDVIWQRRGFSSIHGCVTVISMGSGKILDILGVYDAVAHFSIGDQATIKVFEALGVKPGFFCLAGVNEADRCRAKKAEYKAVEKNKKRRKVLRRKRKQQGDKNEQKEEKIYDPGAF